MGFFDRLRGAFKTEPPATKEAAASTEPLVLPRFEPAVSPPNGGFVGGSTEPHGGREPWPLTLFRSADGTPTLALVARGERQPIHGIHEQLAPFLARLPDEAELWYLCRVADGLHYNVRHLIALEASSGFERVVEFLDPAFVDARPPLRLLRARALLKKGNELQAVDDLKAALQSHVDEADVAYCELSDSGRQTLASEFSKWVQRRPLSIKSLKALPLEEWPTEQLTEVSTKKSDDPNFAVELELDSLLLEMERRAVAEVAPLRTTQAHRKAMKAAGVPSSLRPDLLRRTLEAPDAQRLAIYADALCEAEHPYGEFLSLTLKGGASAKKAKKLAKHYEHAWLGPLALWASAVDYELGLPVGLELGESTREPFVLADVLANPLVASLRRVVRKRSKKTHRSAFDGRMYQQIAKALLPLGLREIEHGVGVGEWAAGSLKQVTHVHDLDLVSRTSLLDPEVLPAVTWVGVNVAPGTSMEVFARLARDGSRFFASRRPHLAIAIPKASEAELSRLRAIAPQLEVSALTVNGEPLR